MWFAAGLMLLLLLPLLMCVHTPPTYLSPPPSQLSPPLQLNCCSRTPETMLLKCESADFQHKNAKANYFATNKESMTAAGGEGWREGETEWGRA